MFEHKISRREFLKLTSMTALAFAATNFFGDIHGIAASKNLNVKTRNGTYVGFNRGGVQTWLGIPYAKPPVGNLRWRAPEPLPASDETFDAKKFGATPIQDRDEVEPASLLPQGEDCLTLNIWSRPSDKPKPVMVFIPGGGFVSGGSGDPIYNGAHLAANGDVVVVTINYRLNVFGFMNFAAIDSSFADSGYLGLKDQIAALTWIKDNIAEFGGDPDNVTIFGESAGSISAMLLMVTPAAKGLFNKAIAQSGHLAFYHKPDASAELAADFMELSGFANMDALLKKSADELRDAYEDFIVARPFSAEVGYLPTCDGKFLPAHPLRELKDGAAHGIKLLTGNTADEYLYWSLYYKNLRNYLRDFHGKITPVMYESEFTNGAELYEAWQKNHADIPDDDRYLEFANQLDWRVGQELAAEYQSAFDDVYFYLFSQTSPVEGLRSCHAVDLPFVFGNPSPDIEPKPSAKLIKQVQAAWTTFAATGNPNNALTPQWNAYTAADRQTMEINSKAWTCRRDLNTQNLTELRGVYEDNLLD